MGRRMNGSGDAHGCVLACEVGHYERRDASVMAATSARRPAVRRWSPAPVRSALLIALAALALCRAARRLIFALARSPGRPCRCLGRRGCGCACAARDRRSAHGRPCRSDDLGAIGQIGKARGHDAVRRRQSRWRSRRRVSFCCVTTTGLAVDDVVGADHIAERPGRTALHRRGRHHDRLRQASRP